MANESHCATSAALQLRRSGTAAPRAAGHVDGRGEQARASDEVGAAVGGEVAEHVAPGAGFQQRGREPALAIAEAFDLGDGDAVIERQLLRVSAASRLPGRGSASEPAESRQVRQTRIVTPN